MTDVRQGSDYDPIADRYIREKATPWRRCVELPTFLQLLGDVRGSSALDLACGDGHFTRILRARGADPVVGVDASAAMIDRARAREAHERLGIEYRCIAVEDMHGMTPSDVVTAAYLLNHATDRADLDAMCTVIAGCLRAGGRFIAINSAMSVQPEVDLRRYGMYAAVGSDIRDGDPYKVTFFDDDGTFTLTDHHWARATTEAAMQAAGLTDIAWHPEMIVQDDPAIDPSHWDEIRATPPFIGLTARIQT